MNVLTFHGTAAAGPAWRRPLRYVAATPAPDIPGLVSRHWRVDRRQLVGVYLFETLAQLDDFASNPRVDIGYRTITDTRRVTLVRTIETINGLDVFDRPIFIIAAPRSGSTLLYDLLRQSDELWSLDGESEGIIEGTVGLHPACRGFDSHRLTDLDANEHACRSVKASMLAGLRDSAGLRYLSASESRPRTVRIVEKTPENTLRLPFLAAVFPDARFVFLHRDARQSVSSMCEAWRSAGFVKYPLLPDWARGAWHLLLPAGWRELNGASLAKIAAFQWASANRQALDDFDALDRETWISVDYDELIATPAAVVRRVCDLAEIEFSRVLEHAAVRPLPLSGTTITAPSPVKWRSSADFSEHVLQPYTRVRARLRDLARVSAPPPPPPQAAATVRFACFIDDLPASTQTSLHDLVVAPACQFQLGSTIPLGLASRTRFRGRFLEGHPLLWVEDPATRAMYAYWVSRKDAWRFGALQPGDPVSSSIDDVLASRLAAAGVLIPRNEPARRHQAGLLSAAKARDRFAAAGYAVLRAAVPSPYVAALARYYRRFVESGDWKEGDEQVTARHGFHNETTARYIHHQLIATVERVVGERVKPTYCYVSAYGEGAVLRPHVDRRQCEFTVSLWLNNDAKKPSGEWPLWFETAAGATSVAQQPGDAVIFRGCDLPHWRDAPTPGAVSTTILFHYVPLDFVGTPN